MLKVGGKTYILVLYVLQELQFPVSSLAQNGSAKRFHDLLDRNRGACELIFRRTGGLCRLSRRPEGRSSLGSGLTRRDQRLLEDERRRYVKFKDVVRKGSGYGLTHSHWLKVYITSGNLGGKGLVVRVVLRGIGGVW